MKFHIVVLLSIVCFYSAMAQHHGGMAMKKDTLPQEVRGTLIGHWEGAAISGDERRTLELDVASAGGDEIQIFWSIRETGIFRRELASWKFESEKSTLDAEGGFITFAMKGRTLDGVISRHGHSAIFVLAKTEKSLTPYSIYDVELRNGDVTLAASLSKPEGKGSFPAIVFLHGSGPETRADWAPFFVDLYTRMGIVCLYYDKRGSGKSTGNRVTSSLDDLSKDATAAVAYLNTQPFVDAKRIGFWGYSQAGWVATNALSFTKDVSFMMIASGGGISPYESEIYSYKTILQSNNVSQEDQRLAMELVEEYFDYMRTGLKREELVQHIARVKELSWYQYVNTERVLVSEKNRKNWSWVATWDPVPSIQTIKFPVLLVFGGQDRDNDTELSIRKWKDGLTRGGNTQFQVKIFPEANHGIRLGSHADGALYWQPYADGYLTTLQEWLRRTVLLK